MGSEIISGLQKLQLLDLNGCETVGGLVKAMASCSFGARMLGEVADTLTAWVQGPDKPVVVCDGLTDGAAHEIARWMQSAGMVSSVLTSYDYTHTRLPLPGGRVVVADACTKRHLPALCEKAGELIFINQEGQCKPGQVRDGYYPNVVFSDPGFVMRVLYAALAERLGKREPTTVWQLMKALRESDGFGHQVSRGARVMLDMINDPDCTVFLTLSGVMTVAQMGLLVCEMIDRGWVDYVASTGALMAHGLVESMGLAHYKYDPRFTDEQLREAELNRVTDTLEPETNFDHIEEIVAEAIEQFQGAATVSPSILHRAIGQILSRKFPDERGILKSAYQTDVPVVVPAFADSEIGNDVYVRNQERDANGQQKLVMNLEHDTELLLRMATKAKKMGIITIGGGVPRNNTQNVAPLVDLLNRRLDRGLPDCRFSYGVRIDPTPDHFGGMSGCTYSEGGSWGKMEFSGLQGGRFAEVRGDATIAWPFMLKWVMEEMDARRGDTAAVRPARHPQN